MQLFGLFKDTVEQTKGKGQQTVRDQRVLGHKHHHRIEGWAENLVIVKKLWQEICHSPSALMLYRVLICKNISTMH